MTEDINSESSSAVGAEDLESPNEDAEIREMVQKFLAENAARQPSGSAVRRACDLVYCNFVKRAIDLIGGIILFIVFFPVMFVAWVAVKVTSEGSGLFSQQRVGLHGKLVTVYKLRSMYIDQDRHVDMDKVREQEETGVLYKMESDPRITRVGRFIRKTSIDELPQIWNVVKGDMSLVGPRPLVPQMTGPFPELSEIRTMVRPGITGEWQVEDRENNTSMVGMIKYDMHYVHNVSLLKDISILLKTLVVVCNTRGAH